MLGQMSASGAQTIPNLKGLPHREALLVNMHERLVYEGRVWCAQERGQETIGGSKLEELLGPLDASCTEATVQGSNIPGSSSQPTANLSSSSDQEKSIVPVSALPP